MEDMFLDVWNRSISAGWLILAVVLLRLVLKKAPKSVRCLLWLLVGIRLACPLSIQSAASLIPSAEMVPHTVLTEPVPQIHTGVETFNSMVNDHLSEHYIEGLTVPMGQTRSIAAVFAQVWLAGMAVMVLWALLDWLRLRWRVAAAVPEPDGVWLCDSIASPFLLGIFRPRIYLPVGLEEDSRTYIVAHEKAHIKRLDHIAKPVGFLLLSVYWFQPLVWLAYILLCRDIELACDERVVRELGAACKKSYSEALLQCSIHRGRVSVLAFGEIGVKERVKNVLHYKKPAFWVIAVSLTACAVAAVCFLTDPVTLTTPETNTVTNEPDAGPDSPDAPDINPLYMNAVEPEISHTYMEGALLYQAPEISSYFIGGYWTEIVMRENTLSATNYLGDTITCKLQETKVYSPEEFSAEFDSSAASLLPEDLETIICRKYTSGRYPYGRYGIEYKSLLLWDITQTNGARQKWIGDSYRLYALIDLNEALPAWCNGAFWTYDPQVSTILPIRFDLEGTVTVTSRDGGTLSRSTARQRQQTNQLTAEPGETIYWQPCQDGAPGKGTTLYYSYRWNDKVWSEKLELRPVMDYQGLYGTKTYGISNNWMGMLSSAIFPSALSVDNETGDLVVYGYSDGPYAIGTSGMIEGRNIPPEVMDAQAAP